MKIVILAGGSGTRLWPLSRKNKPKQVQPFLDRDTLLQKTFKRVNKIFNQKDIIVSAGASQYREIKAQLPKLPRENFVLEPDKRDTAAAIGLVAVYLHQKNPRESFLTINSDHYIKNEKEYWRALKTCKQVINKYPDKTVLVGVRPTYPETGYGYIKTGRKVGKGLYQVAGFTEKPDLALAKKYLATKKYFWNPAIFCWRADHLLELYRRYLPQTYSILKKIEGAIGTSKESSVLKKEFGKIKPISIDYGIMEKIHHDALVIAADYHFTDIGHWETLRSVQDGGEAGNVIKGLSIVYDSTGNLIYNLSNKLVATAGLQNMIIVQTDDALFICPRERAQDAKKVVKLLEENGLVEYL